MFICINARTGVYRHLCCGAARAPPPTPFIPRPSSFAFLSSLILLYSSLFFSAHFSLSFFLFLRATFYLPIGTPTSSIFDPSTPNKGQKRRPIRDDKHHRRGCRTRIKKKKKNEQLNVDVEIERIDARAPRARPTAKRSSRLAFFFFLVSTWRVLTYARRRRRRRQRRRRQSRLSYSPARLLVMCVQFAPLTFIILYILHIPRIPPIKVCKRRKRRSRREREREREREMDRLWALYLCGLMRQNVGL